MRTMRSFVAIFFFELILVAQFFLLNSCRKEDAEDEISVKLVEEEESITVQIANLSNRNVSLENVDQLSLANDEPGLQFLMKDEYGENKSLCAMIHPAKEAGDVISYSLNPHGELESVWQKDSLARRYCLFPGKYQIQVRLIQSGKAYLSNKMVYENAYKP